MTERVLLTAFEPFGGDELNSSLEALRRLDGREMPGIELVTLVLPTEFEAAPRVLIEGIQRVRPDIIVCLGQARGRATVTPERVAINVADARKLPDNADGRPKDEPIVEDGPAAYFSTLPIREIEAELRRNAVPSSVSNTAGTFVCNAVFYALMHALAETPNVRGGFVHVPILPEQAPDGEAPSMALDDVTRAVELAVAVATRQPAATPTSR